LFACTTKGNESMRSIEITDSTEGSASVLQEHGVYVRLAISYVLKSMEVRTMLYLEGECSHATTV
jgi:hypothetical protein